ncbi:hypothetical protein [Nocardioides sp. URHA0020]|uniref:hypothetical protein n=1 Tax=Nocardioides sp. URHA0020 TaxID=1380392 RepID=UPI00048CAB52|nr:hypothetical protein [Nocardioides sp. URHA0020]
MAKFDIPTFEIPTEAARPLYAAAGATDVVVGYVRDAFTDIQKQLAGLQKDVQTRVTSFELEPKTLRDQAVTVLATQIDTLSKDAKARREAIEARVAELQADAMGLPAKVQGFVAENAVTVNSAYADLAKRGETLVGRIRAQESTKATTAAAQTTAAKAKTTKTQATKATKSATTTAKKATKSAAKKTTSTAKKTSTAPKSSAKATTTAAKKTVSSAAAATTDAAAKIGD